MSTIEHQDRVTSRHWQRDCATELVAGHGTIIADYFDVGCSRRRSWRQRPQAAALLATLDDPRRRFDAIVVGEYERAFSASQLQYLAPLLEQHSVQLWLPETNGPVDHHKAPAGSPCSNCQRERLSAVLAGPAESLCRAGAP
ncbi:hypothetical protein ACQSSU_19200 [Micromonospora echinospora]